MCNKKICNILHHAKSNVPFYAQMPEIDETILNTFPIVNRDMILKNPQAFISREYTKFDIKQMLCFRTSGTSTGQPLEIYWKQEDYLRSSCCIWKLRYKWYDIRICDKYVCFHTYLYSGNKAQKNDEFYLISKNNISLNASNLTEEIIGEYCSLIEKYQPVWIQFIPSIGVKFVDYMIKHNIKPFSSVRYIEYNGETLMDSVRKHIDDFFGVKSANLYGSMEVNAIAYECPHHNMVIIDNNVLVEEHHGTVLVTSMHNTVFPFIRYDLGDQIEIKTSQCLCGGKIISKVYGRTTSSIQIGNKFITEAYAAYCIDLINGKLCNIIQQYQFFLSKGSWNLRIFVLPKFKGWHNEIERTIVENMENNRIHLSGNCIEIVYKPIFSSGKKFSIFNYEETAR